MQKPFLTAEWRKLINLTYAVPPELLTEYLPKGVELATIDGKAHVSFVAFDFLDTKVKGIKIPFHVNFPEINLRFYVKYGEETGVVFIREFVPKIMIAKVANWLYNEPYKAIKMRSEVLNEGDSLCVNHYFSYRGKKMKALVKADNKGFFPAKKSLEHYFKEHEWGFGQTRSGKTLKYRVEHLVWEAYPVKSVKLGVDFACLYGEKWGFLKNEKPVLSLLAEGSAIKVYPAKLL